VCVTEVTLHYLDSVNIVQLSLVSAV